MDAGTKRRRRHGVPRRVTHHPPSRLGWLGDGMQMIATALATANDNIMDGDEDHFVDDSRSVPARNADAGTESTSDHPNAAIDLTDDNDEDESNPERGRNRVFENEFEFTSSQESLSLIRRIETATSKHSPNNRINRGVEQATTTTDGNNSSASDGWACRACTLINYSENSDACDACGEKRFGSRELRQRRQHSKPSSSLSINKVIKESKNGHSSNRITSRTSSIVIGTRKFIAGGVQPAHTDKNSAMWIDKYAPLNSQELCVAPKKVEQVRRFLSSYIDYMFESQRQEQQSQQKLGNNGGNSMMEKITSNCNYNKSSTIVTPPETKMMILIGNPGVGKSAMVRTLAREMNIQILSWNDAYVEYNTNTDTNFHRHQQDDSLGSGSLYYDTLPYQSQLNSFDEFLTTSGLGIHSLDLVGGDADATLIPRGSNGRFHKETKKRKREGFVGSVILMEEIPNLYNAEAALSFRNIMERHIQRTQIPTIFIYSDVQEGNHKPEDLERLFPTHLLNSPLVQMVSIQPVTKSKMKKCLQSIAKAEMMGTDGGSTSRLVLSSADFEDMHLASGGDLRHAIFAMQFRSGRIGSGERSNGTSKDAKLSTFHALGKLLYAKRKQQSSREVATFSDDDESFQSKLAAANTDIMSKWDDKRGPLEFIPEDVMSCIDMGIGPSLSFLSYHSPDFFTDITDLSRSYDLLSDAVIFVDRFTGQQSDGPFPDKYAAFIGGRAVADANKHPAPPQFRQLSAPKVFSVMKNSRENETKIDLLRKRLETSIHSIIGSAQQFITDSLPYMRNVIPQDINFALASLHSLAKNSIEHAEPQALGEEIFVLSEDDLVDDDDST